MHQHHHRRGDRIDTAFARDRAKHPVHAQEFVLDRIDEIGNVVASRQPAQPVDDHAAGDVAGTVAAESVGDDPEPEIVGDQDRVFVVSPHVPGFGTAGGEIRARSLGFLVAFGDVAVDEAQVIVGTGQSAQRHAGAGVRTAPPEAAHGIAVCLRP